jgi:hypothetical protein
VWLSDSIQATLGDSRCDDENGRIYALGTNIDELPQFFNVFVGRICRYRDLVHYAEAYHTIFRLINNYAGICLLSPEFPGWAG